MPQRSATAAQGLRERKKQRTRATIIDVAAQLCAEHGFESTTVDQIATAADVSPRTFSRYFPSKDAVIGALIEETSEHVARSLLRQPRDITEHEALIRAHMEVLGAAERGEPAAVSFDRVASFLQIVRASPMLGLSAFAFRPEGSTTAVSKALAARMGVRSDDPAVRIVLDTWAVLVATAVDRPDVATMGPAEMMRKVEQSYRLFTRLWQPWVTGERTPPDAEHP